MASRKKRRLVTQSEYARHRQVTRQYVGKLVSQGVIDLIEGLVDVEAADATLAAIADPGKAYSKRKHPGYDALLDESPADLGKRTESLADQLLKARIKRETEQGRLAELNRLKREGELVEFADIERAQYNRAEAEREAFLNWPTRVSAEMAADLGVEERKLFQLLDRAIRKHLEERSKAVLAPGDDDDE